MKLETGTSYADALVKRANARGLKFSLLRQPGERFLLHIQMAGCERHLRAVGHAELSHDRGHVLSPWPDTEVEGDLLAEQAFGDCVQDPNCCGVSEATRAATSASGRPGSPRRQRAGAAATSPSSAPHATLPRSVPPRPTSEYRPTHRVPAHVRVICPSSCPDTTIVGSPGYCPRMRERGITPRSRHGGSPSASRSASGNDSISAKSAGTLSAVCTVAPGTAASTARWSASRNRGWSSAIKTHGLGRE